MTTSAETLTDEAVIEGIGSLKEMDRVLRFLYREHYGLLETYVVRNSGSEDDAADIFQDVMLAFVNLVQAGKFRGESSIKTFLYALTRNTWLNELKRRGRAETREMKYEIGMDKSDLAADAVIENREMNALLMKTMEELGETCKKILVLFYFENMSMKDMVASTSYENEQVVRNKKYKCLKKLEEMIMGNPVLYRQLKNLLHE
ncbi:MAG: RNA polymerase sigma factor [Flavisolibacter sp.]|jgi:RNA polymerase sigma factor (sigma-70 family)